MTRMTLVMPDTTATSAGTAFSPTFAATSGASCAGGGLDAADPALRLLDRARRALAQLIDLLLQGRRRERRDADRRSHQRDQHDEQRHAARHDAREPTDGKREHHSDEHAEKREQHYLAREPQRRERSGAGEDDEA